MKKTTKIRKPKCLKLLKFLILAILQMEVWTKEIVTLDVRKKGEVIPNLLWVRCPAFNPDRYTLQSHEHSYLEHPHLLCCARTAKRGYLIIYSYAYACP